MPNLNTKKVGERFVGLFVGDPGTGKTIAAGSFPGPIKFFDFDDNIQPLIPFYPMRDDIDYVTVVSNRSERRDTISFLEFCQEFMAFEDRCPYETIVLDSLTRLSGCCILYGLELNGEFNLLKGKMPKVGMEDYKGETAIMSKILEVMKSLPCNVIATAHPIKKLEITVPGDMASLQSTWSLTSWGSKTPTLIPASFNEMYYFYNRAASQPGQHPKRLISTVSTEDFPCKTSLPLPPIIEVTDKPLYGILQKYIKEFIAKVEDARKKKGEVQTA